MDDAEALSALADWLGALGHPDRLRLLLALADEEKDVATLAAQVALPQPRTSQHLALLKAHDVVTARREGRRVRYRLRHPAMIAWIGDAAGFLVEDADRKADLGAWLSRLQER